MFNLNKKNLIPLLAFIFLAVILSISISNLRAPVVNISRPPLSLFALAQRELGGIIAYHHNFVQNEELRREVDFLRNKLNSLKEIALENSRLKNTLSFKQKSALRFIAARVISRSADNWSSGLIVDKGSLYGIKRGMAVVTYLGLVGRVVDVTSMTAKVMLLNDPNLGVSSLVQRSRQEGLVSGTLGDNLIMRYLPQDADIQLNDIIVSSGLNDAYPKGLLIGTVVDVGQEFSGLSRFAMVKPVVNLFNIEEVLIVVP